MLNHCQNVVSENSNKSKIIMQKKKKGFEAENKKKTEKNNINHQI